MSIQDRDYYRLEMARRSGPKPTPPLFARIGFVPVAVLLMLVCFCVGNVGGGLLFWLSMRGADVEFHGAYNTLLGVWMAGVQGVVGVLLFEAARAHRWLAPYARVMGITATVIAWVIAALYFVFAAIALGYADSINYGGLCYIFAALVSWAPWCCRSIVIALIDA
jgi:hypothetical protein